MQAAGNTVPRTSDRECLESWARHRDADSLQTLVERYLGFVHSSALRRTGDAAQAAEVTRAVFLVLAAACATEGCADTVPEGLSLDILQSMEASRFLHFPSDQCRHPRLAGFLSDSNSGRADSLRAEIAGEAV